MPANNHQIGVIGGDGIGPEVTAEAVKVLETVSKPTISNCTSPLPHGTEPLSGNR